MGQQYEMFIWHHWLNGQEFEQALRGGKGQGNLQCAAVHGVSKSQKLLNDWTTMLLISFMKSARHWHQHLPKTDIIKKKTSRSFLMHNPK